MILRLVTVFRVTEYENTNKVCSCTYSCHFSKHSCSGLSFVHSMLRLSKEAMGIEISHCKVLFSPVETTLVRVHDNSKRTNMMFGDFVVYRLINFWGLVNLFTFLPIFWICDMPGRFLVLALIKYLSKACAYPKQHQGTDII